MRTGTAIGGRRSAALVLAAWLGFVAVGLAAIAVAPDRYADPDRVREFFLGFGILAPVVFVAVQAFQVVVAPVPGQVLGFVAGYLFGAVIGTGLSVLGAAIGTAVAVWLARRYGRPAVERLVQPRTLDTFDAAVERRGLLSLFVVFLVPGLPDDAICFAAGLTRIRLRRVVAVSVVGRLPGYAVVAFAGARLAGGHGRDAIWLLATLAFVSIAVYLRRETVRRWLVGARADPESPMPVDSPEP